jgi:CrcB protein
MWYKLIGLAVAGACGTLARYGVSGLVQRWLGPAFPWGTAMVNVIGCFLLGLAWAVTADRWNISPETRMVILVGFVGAFTTFSTFIGETNQLLADSEVLLGLGNVALQVLVGLALFALGQAVGRTV